MIKKKSLFDDIYKLQSTAPELDDIDPEDPHDGNIPFSNFTFKHNSILFGKVF